MPPSGRFASGGASWRRSPLRQPRFSSPPLPRELPRDRRAPRRTRRRCRRSPRRRTCCFGTPASMRATAR
ncbi:MAG: hypothetical protein DMG04_16405 [Acidobacteria bacterium]|nr:MAG: hypothetical protein DMG04_16405 [Acidobacteriota bacterium]PYQ86143.1 MAG: hypothetical protein DMG02_25460 [Acidobacteriota bacterium]PYQ87542.1 MAG: hypothetical protein DMG03_05380 [Acidobacteriota bacterium]PYR09064.1 MAG: hypothetical protein DMF99_16975 [Acidobacteriota bacterium]